MDLDSILKSIELTVGRFGGRIIYSYREEFGDPELGPHVDDVGLDPRLVDALKSSGIYRFFRFQFEALKSIGSGRDTVIVSGTGTGKTEAFLTPIVDNILRNGGLKPGAVLVYPTKALARDQVSRMRLLSQPGLGVRVSVLDGDTPVAERARIYSDPPDILVTNPDMVHYGLAYHGKLKRLLSNAKFIVFDELHSYNGVFGSHVRWVIQRMLRYAGDSILIGSGATIGNPEDLGWKLFNRKPEVIEGPRRRRGIAVHSFIDSGHASRWSLSAALIAALVSNGLKVLAFTDSQQMAELVTRIALKNYNVKVAVHRAGLKAEYRKSVEEAFKKGSLRALVATPTMELGVDIGDLDAVVLTGLPKSYSSYIQRAGRAGRRGRAGLVFTILGDDAIEAYFASRPGEYFEQSVPPSYIEPYNMEVVKTHLAAMILERGLLDLRILPVGLREAVKAMESEGLLRMVDSKVYGDFKKLRAYMESRGGLRSTGYLIKIYDGSEEIGSRELPEALYDLHPGAVYYHAGKPYISVELDLESGRALVRRITGEINFYTRPLYTVDVEAIKPLSERNFGPVKLVYGEVKVTVRVEGYVVKEEGSGVTLSDVLLQNPLIWSYWTKGVAGRYPNPGISDLTLAISSYHALEHVLITASKPVAGVADTDVGGVSYPSGHIVIYDSSPGGNGASRLVLERIESIARVSEEIMASCDCEDGCPRCVFSPYCGNNNQLLSRRGALKVLRSVLLKAAAPMELGEPEGEPLA